MRRVGILGGTFNPIHIGHLAIAQAAYEKCELDKVIFVPSNLPPHKSIKNIIPAQERFNMVQLAIEGYKNFEVSDFEISRPGKSYTVDTIEYFYDFFKKKARLFFILGEDCFSALDTWKRVDDIEKLATFVVVNRPQSKVVFSKTKVRAITMPGLDVSSSYVRKRISLEKTIKYLVPENVKTYIDKKNLYKK